MVVATKAFLAQDRASLLAARERLAAAKASQLKYADRLVETLGKWATDPPDAYTYAYSVLVFYATDDGGITWRARPGIIELTSDHDKWSSGSHVDVVSLKDVCVRGGPNLYVSHDAARSWRTIKPNRLPVRINGEHHARFSFHHPGRRPDLAGADLAFALLASRWQDGADWLAAFFSNGRQRWNHCSRVLAQRS